MSIVANQLIIRKKSAIKNESIINWKNKIKSLNLNPITEVVKDFGNKWMSEDFAKEKLGL